jgi:DNA-binding SARP family transcriptional activator/tetratricopeptide (TPR) repeat protein
MEPGMEFCLLGPVVVRRGTAVVPVPRGGQRAVLASLLLKAGQVVSLDELAETLWGAEPPLSARVAIQNHVMRLRQSLGDAGSRIRTQPPGYLIHAEAGELDVARFQAHVAAAQAAARERSWDVVVAEAGAALALWRGEPLAGAGSDSLAMREVPRLEEMRLQALEARADAELQLGHGAGVIPELRELAGAHPLRERLHGLLMLALYRDGRRGEALAAYRQARRFLAEELGTEPGRALRDLHQQVLTGDPALGTHGGPGQDMTAPAPAAAPAAAVDVRFSLPPDSAAFTGREAELDRITATVAEGARSGGVVAIHAIGGMPGIGKTALAVHAAHLLREQFPGRCLFIDLHAHTPGHDPALPEAALAGLLAAAGVEARQLPGDVAGRAALWRDKMAGQRGLLVLDNAASSRQVVPLLPGGGTLVLVTSRRHLGDLPGAVAPLLLQALPPAEAGQMFTRLAPRAATDPQAVAELAGLAGHLPLAVSLLARLYARHPSWTLADLIAETRDSVLAVAAENDTVAAAFELSYRHLDPALQRFFAVLGLHPGGTTDPYAAAALAGTSLPEATVMLDRLHGEGLLTEAGYRRYGMHDLLRRYARDHAATLGADDAGQAVGRLLDYYTQTAARADALLSRQTRPAPAPVTTAPPARSPAALGLADAGQALAWARAERASLLACLDHATREHQHARVIALTAALAELLRRDGPYTDAVTRHATALRAARDLGDRLAQANTLNDLGIARRLTGDYPGATQDLEQALAQYRDLGDRLGQANTLKNLGVVRWVTGDYPAAAGDYGQALALFRNLGDRLGQANALHSLGNVRRVTGDYPGAAQDLEQAMALFRDLGDRLGQANALLSLGEVRRLTGDFPGAAQDLEQALAIYRDLGDRLGQANALHGLGTMRRTTGDFPGAAQDLEQALASYRDLGHRGGEADALNEAGTLYRLRGEPARARAHHQQALELALAIGAAWDEAHALAGLGRCAIVAADLTTARAQLGRAAAIFRRIGAPEATAVTTELAALTTAGPATQKPRTT